MSEWRNIYRRFVQFKKEWSVHKQQLVNDELFRVSVLTTKSDAEIEREFASYGVAIPSAALMREARALRAALQFPSDGRHPDKPCEDVYQAALAMMPHGVWTASPDHEQLYRGQRDARWRVVPSFFRESHEKQQAMLTHVNALAKKIAARRPELKPEQTLALIQHYSKELAAPTWLIDLTWDPAVALFFASDGAKTGDIGVVTMLVKREWERLGAGGLNRLGRIRVIDVPDVLRIERQRALFLDTSHPDLLEQYVAHSVWFRQVDGLTFEDLDSDWPVSRERCYPERDLTLEKVLKGLMPLKGAKRVETVLTPEYDASEPLGIDEYFDIAQSWCDEYGLDWPYAQVLERVCMVHSRLQEHRQHFSIALRSLHRLEHATEVIQNAQKRRRKIDITEALAHTLERTMTDDERELLEEFVMEAKGKRRNVRQTDLPTFISSVLVDLTPELAELVVIGVPDASDERVMRDKDALHDAGGFSVFDLRGSLDRHGLGALATEVKNGVRVLIVDAKTQRTWLDRLARAFLDQQDYIQFPEGQVARSSAVIVWYGAEEIGDLPYLLREPIVQFFD